MLVFFYGCYSVLNKYQREKKNDIPILILTVRHNVTTQRIKFIFLHDSQFQQKEEKKVTYMFSNTTNHFHFSK